MQTGVAVFILESELQCHIQCYLTCLIRKRHYDLGLAEKKPDIIARCPLVVCTLASSLTPRLFLFLAACSFFFFSLAALSNEEPCLVVDGALGASSASRWATAARWASRASHL